MSSETSRNPQPIGLGFAPRVLGGMDNVALLRRLLYIVPPEFQSRLLKSEEGYEANYFSESQPVKTTTDGKELVTEDPIMHLYSFFPQAAYCVGKLGDFHSCAEELIGQRTKEIQETLRNFIVLDKNILLDKLPDECKFLLAKRYVIWKNDVSKEIHVAFKGTQHDQVSPLNFALELYLDFQILIGYHQDTRTFNCCLKLCEAIVEKYKGYKITVSGHSLGGGISLHVSERLNLEGYHYNPAVAINGCHVHDASIVGETEVREQHIYRTLLDPVSSVVHMCQTNDRMTPLQNTILKKRKIIVVNNNSNYDDTLLAAHKLEHFYAKKDDAPEMVRNAENILIGIRYLKQKMGIAQDNQKYLWFYKLVKILQGGELNMNDIFGWFAKFLPAQLRR